MRENKWILNKHALYFYSEIEELASKALYPFFDNFCGFEISIHYVKWTLEVFRNTGAQT